MSYYCRQQTVGFPVWLGKHAQLQRKIKPGEEAGIFHYHNSNHMYTTLRVVPGEYPFIRISCGGRLHRNHRIHISGLITCTQAMYPCTPPAYPYISLHIPTYPCIPLHTPAYPSIPLHTIAYSCIPPCKLLDIILLYVYRSLCGRRGSW